MIFTARHRSSYEGGSAATAAAADDDFLLLLFESSGMMLCVGCCVLYCVLLLLLIRHNGIWSLDRFDCGRWVLARMSGLAVVDGLVLRARACCLLWRRTRREATSSMVRGLLLDLECFGYYCTMYVRTVATVHRLVVVG